MRCLESKDVVKGSELVLEGQVSGSAPFTVSLYKNGKPVRNDKRHRITVKDDLIALQVLAVDAGDVGSYHCTVENEVGEASSDCQVTLKGLFRRFGFIYKLSFTFSAVIFKTGPSHLPHAHSWIAPQC